MVSYPFNLNVIEVKWWMIDTTTITTIEKDSIDILITAAGGDSQELPPVN